MPSRNGLPTSPSLRSTTPILIRALRGPGRGERGSAIAKRAVGRPESRLGRSPRRDQALTPGGPRIQGEKWQEYKRCVASSLLLADRFVLQLLVELPGTPGLVPLTASWHGLRRRIQSQEIISRMVGNTRFPCRFWAASAFVLRVTTSASIGAMGKGHVEVTLPIAVADGTGFKGLRIRDYLP
ncbi:hypothetical protein OH76DRAFT_1395360 [Lentinus brumalis]|uniref:Uncharacterized protein n=1 Tax=Lentinus brumalis TaxID=2498619 RepID=A0A371DYF3_9APHY|nr:hypothetical protein OH76DRAFT_1395360 [Polyporus brumalis]